MRQTAENNRALLENARSNAKELLKNYIKSIGDAMGVEYTIVWVDAEDVGKVSVDETVATTESSAA